MDTEEQKKAARDLRRRLKTGAVALVTSASVLVGGIFQPPALMPEEQDLTPQIVYAEDDEDDLDGSGDDGDEGGGESAEPVPVEESETWDDERRKVQKLPLAVKLLAIPLCALVCWLVFTGSAALFGSFLGAVAAKALAWLLALAALLLGTAVTVKTLFPDLPLKKIFTKRTVSGVLIGGAALAALDLLLPLLWAEYSRVEALVHALGVLAVIGAAAGSFARREKKRRAEEALAIEEQIEEEPEEEEEKPLTREDILALADTVSRRRK